MHIKAEVWETREGERDGQLDKVLDTFEGKKFRFVSLPRRGDHLTLTTNEIRPPILYIVENVRFDCMTEDAGKVAWSYGPTARVYVSRLRTLTEYL